MLKKEKKRKREKTKQCNENVIHKFYFKNHIYFINNIYKDI